MAFRRVEPRHLASSLVTVGTLLLAACGDDGGNGTATDESAAVEPPAGNVPESVEAVELTPLGDPGAASSDDDPAGDAPGQAAGTLGDLLGERPIVLNFFASWCAPCIQEMPDLEAVHRDHGEEVVFLGMAMQDGEDRAQEVVDTTGVTYPTYTDPRGDAFTFFGGTNMPTTVFLAADGEVLDVHSRPLSESQLRDRVDELLASR